jgi:hypothetical protein
MKTNENQTPESETIQDSQPEKNEISSEVNAEADVNKKSSSVFENMLKIAGNVRKFLTFGNISFLFLIVSFLFVGYYIIFPSRGEFHADCTDTLMWAEATYDSGKIFNEDFEYACLLAFGGQWIMVPLIAVFGVTMKTQILGMYIFFIIFMVSLFAMLKMMKIPTSWSMLTLSVTMLMLSCSKKLREIFWGHVIYYSLGMLYAFVGLALIFRLINIIDDNKSGRKKKFIITGILLFIWCVLAGANQLEILTLFLIPAMGAIIGERFFSFEKYKSKKELYANIMILAIVVMGTVAGYLLGNVIIGDIKAGYASANSNLTVTDDWGTNFMKIFPFFATLIGLPNTDRIPIMSVDGINAVLRIMMTAILIAVPFITTFLYPKIKNRQIRIFIIFHWIMTFFIMIGFVCGMLSGANWRLSPILCTSVIMMTILAQWIWNNTDKKRIGVLTMLPLLVISFWTINDIGKMPKDYNQDTGLYVVADYLVENNLTYGYATFWNANSITVISDSKTKARNIEVTDDGEYKTKYYQSRKSWYEDQPEQENYYMLLSQYEYECLKNNANPLLDEQHTEASVEGYMILVFDKNIF